MIKGETIIITSEESKLSKEPILIRLIAEFTTADDEIKRFCFNNDLNVRLHKDGNYMIDLSDQLGFTVINIEDGLIYLSLPRTLGEKERRKLEECSSLFNGNSSVILYYYDQDNKDDDFCQKVFYGSTLRKMNFIEDHLGEYTKLSCEKEDGKVFQKKM